MPEKLFLIDASSSIYRAFYALPMLTTAAGVPTNATLGFVNMLQKLLREHRPDYVVVVWDSPDGEKRRQQLYADYKATRDAMPEALAAQLPQIRRVVAAYGLASMEYPGEEADDVIATLTRHAERAELAVTIVSTDRDLMQLVSDRVTLLDTMRDRAYGPAEVEARFGVPPDRMLELRALSGDSSDNIPGVRGIGEKGAAKLIAAYGTLENLLAHSEELPSARQREALRAGAESARLSRELSRLSDDLPLAFDLPRFAYGEPDSVQLREIFGELELGRLLEALGGPPAGAESAPAPVRTERVVRAQDLPALVRRIETAAEAALIAILDPPDPMRGELVGLAVATAGAEPVFLCVDGIGEAALLEALRPLLTDVDRRWVGHDLKSLCVALGRRGVAVEGTLRDTAVAAYVVDPSSPAAQLEAIAQIYLSQRLPSPDSVFGKGAKRIAARALPPDELAAFAGLRAVTTLELLPRIEERLAADGQLALFQDLESPLIGVLARMELAGVRVDETHLAVLSAEIERELAQLERRIHALAGEPFNIGSPKQLQRILFEKLALPPTKRTKTGFSTDQSVLEELAIEYELPREVLSHRTLSKLRSTYVDALPQLVHPETGRIHCSFNQTVAATGRLSASNPNLQNIPVRTPLGRRIREAFIPAEGRLLLSSDYSQIELRILAHLAEDASLLAAFREGADIHVRTAAQIFGLAPEAVSEDQRARTKAINFGIIYGSSAYGLARQLGISQAEAKAHIQAYFERYPGVRRFLDATVRRARERGYAETIAGRRRYLPDLRSRNRALKAAAERMATNSVIQGTAADLLKRAMVRIDRELRAAGAPPARMILTVHDELVFEVAPEAAPALETLVSAQMCEVADLTVPLEVRVGVGRSWLEAH